MYELDALIGLGPAPSGSVALPQGAWLVPLIDDNPHIAAELSRQSPVAHVTAGFYGGLGSQAASLYRDGRPDIVFEAGYHAINAALHALGITAEPPNYAFDTLRLGRYRRTELWLRETTPPPSS